MRAMGVRRAAGSQVGLGRGASQGRKVVKRHLGDAGSPHSIPANLPSLPCPALPCPALLPACPSFHPALAAACVPTLWRSPSPRLRCRWRPTTPQLYPSFHTHSLPHPTTPPFPPCSPSRSKRCSWRSTPPPGPWRRPRSRGLWSSSAWVPATPSPPALMVRFLWGGWTGISRGGFGVGWGGVGGVGWVGWGGCGDGAA